MLVLIVCDSCRADLTKELPVKAVACSRENVEVERAGSVLFLRL